MNLLIWFGCMCGCIALALLVMHVLYLRDAHGGRGKKAPEERAIQAIVNEATASDRAATEKMRRDCVQQVRMAWSDGQISQDAYEWISGNIRNLE